MDKKVYRFLLDFFPLVDDICRENAIVGSAMQMLALEALLDAKQDSLDKLPTLLNLSRDLGYAPPEVVDFLRKQLTRLREQQSLRTDLLV